MSEAGACGAAAGRGGGAEGCDALKDAGNPGGRRVAVRAGGPPVSKSSSTFMGRSGEGTRQVILENPIQSRAKPWTRREMIMAAIQGER
ncbi:hypothetical protein [Ferrovum sp.]|nr:hypothetical protein [Ferrovum sp.]